MAQLGRVARRLGMLRNRVTIRTQTAVLAALLCAGAVALAAMGAAALGRQEAVKGAERDLVMLGRTMADRLDQHMFERYREIGILAGLDPLRPVWSARPQEARVILEGLQATLPNYAWIGLAGTDGVVRAATQGMLEGVSVAERPWFVAGLQAPAVQDVHDAKLLDSLLRTSQDQAPFRFVDVAVPVRGTAGELVGVIGAHLSWSWADTVKESVLTNQNAPADTELLVLSQDGTVLIGSSAVRPPEEAQATNGAGGEAIFVEKVGGTPMLTALVATVGQGDYPGLGWVVAARRPLAAAVAPADALVFRIGMIGGVVALLAAALAWVLAGTVTRPITSLTQSLDRIGRVAMARSVERQNGSSDVLQLSAAVRSLLRRVGTAEAGAEAASAAVQDLRREMEDQARAADEATRRLDSDISQLRTLAETDPLTGLLNRRAFLSFAEEAMAQFRRSQGNACVLMFDIDHFKQVNDSFGHSAGDEVIRMVGRIIAAQVRSTDKAARVGGEEFVALLRETDEAGARRLAERIREQIADTIVPHHGFSLNVTASAGVALVLYEDRDVEDVIFRADKALYAAKAAGRNRVAVSERPGRDLRAA